MELPEVGSHCTVSSCNRLDFLPFECDACHKIFCKDHQTYNEHNCTEGLDKNVVVPTCPLCNQPVPVARGDDPNIKVNQHIQQECRSDKANKLYTNKCSFPGCKKKELVPVTCNNCRQNFCLKHRLETNHNCQGPQRSRGRPASNKANPSRSSGAVRSKPSASRNPQSTSLSQIGADLHKERLQRQQQQQRQQQPHSSQSNSHLSEDEALRRAIAASMSDQPSSSSAGPSPRPPQEHTTQPNTDEDEALARAIAASLNEQPQPKPKSKPPQPPQRQDSNCLIS
ncbi:AN1-type zinc finger protein 2A-like [Halichondria panicea]|uniref:AN1-type zinc finger protein 2A-like n=1 Tax=Halichondria panicea TaxID=6063 RepID=UPI00312BA112